MLTVAERKHDDSDSEDDADYIPPVATDDSSDDEPKSKRARTTSPPPKEVNEFEKKQARDALWASFQASVASPSLPIQPEPPKAKVKIEKRYRFAGEDVVEVVEVDADSPDAKKWPLWLESNAKISNTYLPSSSTVSTDVPTPSSSSSYTPTPTDNTSTKLPAKRPGRRKPKVTLAALPTPASTKAKKLSTLDKSAMDWQSHIQTAEDPGLKDELEANRRSGGYLEKVEFLKRVDERKEDVVEANKGSKRRRL